MWLKWYIGRHSYVSRSLFFEKTLQCSTSLQATADIVETVETSKTRWDIVYVFKSLQSFVRHLAAYVAFSVFGNTESDIYGYTQGATVYSIARWTKVLGYGQLYDRPQLNELFIEGLLLLTRRSMRAFWCGSMKVSMRELFQHAD